MAPDMLAGHASPAGMRPMISGRRSRLLARFASVLWIPIAAVYTVLILGYLYALLTGYVRPPLPEVIVQILVYASIAGPGWLLVWALWSRAPSWRIAITSAVIGGLLFLLLAGTLLAIVALAAGLLPLVSRAIRAEPIR
jgi:hypothetical protein